MTIEYRTATEEQKSVIEELLAAPFPATLETIAARLDLTPLAAAQLLGRDMCSFVTGDVAEGFDEVWESLAQWERATLFIQHGGHVFEIEAKLSAGKRAQGYYNILHKNAVVGGHLKFDAVGAIAFASIPFMKRESHCVIFFDKEGKVSFSVYLGRENHKIIESVKTLFFAGKEAFCA